MTLRPAVAIVFSIHADGELWSLWAHTSMGRQDLAWHLGKYDHPEEGARDGRALSRVIMDLTLNMEEVSCALALQACLCGAMTMAGGDGPQPAPKSPVWVPDDDSEFVSN